MNIRRRSSACGSGVLEAQPPQPVAHQKPSWGATKFSALALDALYRFPPFIFALRFPRYVRPSAIRRAINKSIEVRFDAVMGGILVAYILTACMHQVHISAYTYT